MFIFQFAKISKNSDSSKILARNLLKYIFWQFTFLPICLLVIRIRKRSRPALRRISTFSCYLKLIQSITYLSLIPRHCSPNQIKQFFPFNIIITLISECKGMKFFYFVQDFLFHKVCDLYHATLFTTAQQSKIILLYGAFYVANLQNVPAHNIKTGICVSQFQFSFFQRYDYPES